MAVDGVRRRHVFFITGFDPKGAGYYHRMYQDEAACRTRLGDLTLDVAARKRSADGSVWTVRAATSEAEYQRTVETVFEALRWDDIVRQHWPRSRWRSSIAWLGAYWLYLRTGAAKELQVRNGWRRMVVFGMPALCMLAAFGFGIAFAALVFGIARALDVGLPASACAAAGSALLTFLAGMWVVHRIEVGWLGHLFAFTADWARGRLPTLEPRIERMADAIANRLQDTTIDEVLVIGYSVGSVLAVDALGRAVGRARAAGWPSLPQPSGPALSLLTLGHCIPLLTVLPGARGVRDRLSELAATPALVWRDFSDPTDWAACAYIDPMADCEPTIGADMPGRPLLMSPRFHAVVAPDRYAELRNDKRELHLQYLRAPQQAGGYDYFAITAGELTLGQRYFKQNSPP